MLWQFSQKILLQLISFSVSVVLARLLMPEDYGIVAICGMIMVLIGILVDSGLGLSLIQKKEVDELDLSTAFYATLLISLLGILVIYAISPFIAGYFGNAQISTVIRILSLSMPIGALAIVQNAFVRRQMLFRKFFISSLIGTVISAIVGLYMAYAGFGVWALVGQHLSNSIVNTLTLYLIIEWHPTLVFSFKRLRGMLSFGLRMTVINFLTTFAYQLKGYIIGLKYTPTDLAYYNRGEGIPGILYNNINGTISSVLFPALARLQDDKIALRNALRRSIRTVSFILVPLLFGLAAVADKVVVIVFSDKWIEAIPYMQVVCFISCSDILGLANYQALQALGKADVLMKLEFVKRPVMLVIITVSMFISPLAIAIGMLIYSIFAFLVNAIPNKIYIDYSIKNQIKDISVTLLLSLIMLVVVVLIGLLSMNMFLLVTSQIIIGGGLYILLSYIFNRDDFLYVYRLINKRIFSKFKIFVKNEK